MPSKKQHQLNFTGLLMHWHLHENDRQMPWKGESDPYKIWLSEVILQQTQVSQGLAYYLRFIETFPTVDQLAAAPDELVYKLWEGLGYYSRCKNLLVAARQVSGTMQGVFPTLYPDIRSLKGVGDYTAAAIASFAFGLPYAVVDGNVNRVLSRYFNLDIPIDSTTGKRLFAALAQELLNVDNPALYNQAIMDFGATVCKPKQPACKTCILSPHCQALQQQTVYSLPVKSKKTEKKTRWLCYLKLLCEEGVMVRQRGAGDIWENLHEFYLVESAEAFDWSDKNFQMHLANALGVQKAQIEARSEIYTQQLTHQTIHSRYVKIRLQSYEKPLPDGYFWTSPAALKNLAWPKITAGFIDKNSPFATNFF